ncbi:Diphthamide biosynthesis protein 2 [Taxawa tesnikishii (nom. ined.)]|nr:Diphthamide biosynthesis protein 2 [Dothideales sp. JES 119]
MASYAYIRGSHPSVDTSALPKFSDEQLYLTYEIKRTVDEIRNGKWKRIALQFPDEMLVDAPRVYEALRDGLRNSSTTAAGPDGSTLSRVEDNATKESGGMELDMDKLDIGAGSDDTMGSSEEKLCILADTSYGACCVDEVAAEHVDAEVVVHYGRSCLSPTARLPVIYVFTTRPLDIGAVVESFRQTHPDTDTKVILMADIPYSSHVPEVYAKLRELDYTNVFATSVIHDPSSPLPNRSVPPEIEADAEALREFSLFHISEPPTSLVLTVSSRVSSIHIYPTVSDHSGPPQALPASTAQTLRRRYALVTKLSTVSIFGILINTLSVKNYMSALSHVQELIRRAGKKSYTFVVGKVNAAKVANFSEVDGWVIIGCWESSLIESRDFWKPIITPFELELALTDENERIWTGEWKSDFQSVLENVKGVDGTASQTEADTAENGADGSGGGWEDEEESEPPQFDLRTGRYISHTRPMGRPSNTSNTNGGSTKATPNPAKSLIKRANGDIAQIGGEISPAAEFLRSKRTWQGLGSDYEIAYDYDEEGKIRGTPMEEGRSGIAKGYAVGESQRT